MKKNIGWIIVVVILSVMLIFSMVFGSLGVPGAAKPTPTDIGPTITPLPTSTPDPCSLENIAKEVARVNALTREFEDTALLLTSTLLRDTSVQLVQDLQRIKRVAEDQVVPSCLTDLKAYQVAHMNARIEVFGTALAFLNVYGPNGDQKALNKLLEPSYAKAEMSARQYENEYARVLGLPIPTLPAVITTTLAP